MRDRIDFIQALRGIAALAVVFCHGRFVLNDIGPGLGDQLFTAGAAGVDLFFIISGFIMVYTTANVRGGVDDAISFMIKRVARVWPVYVVLTIFYVWGNGNTEFAIQIPWLDDPKNAANLARSLFFYPLDAASGGPYYGQPVLYNGWTLTYEMYFYTIFGASLLFGRWRWGALVIWFSGTLIAAPAVLGDFTFNAYVNQGLRPAYLNVVTNPIVFDFIIGIGIGLFYQSRFIIRNGEVLGVALLLAVSAGFFQWATLFHAKYGITGYALPMAAIVLTLALMNKRQEIKVPAALVWIGNISYSLYLIHPLCQIMPTLMLHKYGLHKEAMGWGIFVFDTALAVTLAYVSYLTLEERLSRIVRNSLTWVVTTGLSKSGKLMPAAK